jgi:hypothetical protein
MKHNRGRPKWGFIGCLREITAARGDPATVRNNRDGPNEIGLIFTVLIGFFKLKWGSYVPNK